MYYGINNMFLFPQIGFPKLKVTKIPVSCTLLHKQIEDIECTFFPKLSNTSTKPVRGQLSCCSVHKITPFYKWTDAKNHYKKKTSCIKILKSQKATVYLIIHQTFCIIFRLHESISNILNRLYCSVKNSLATSR